MAFPLLPVSSNTRINASVTRSVLQNKIKSITNEITKKQKSSNITNMCITVNNHYNHNHIAVPISVVIYVKCLLISCHLCKLLANHLSSMQITSILVVIYANC
jgi:predicted unusual protein kinase regulating ubiquinone biosynthesis (AarF/ABC1/UbiB family)